MRSSRLLQILLLLQTRRQLTARELADELEVSLRTIYRDVEALAAAGVPVYADQGRAGGYRLVDGYRTKLTGLTEGEAAALFLVGMPGPAAALGLTEQTSTAELKLLAALAPNQRDKAGQLKNRFHLDMPAWYRDAEESPYLSAVASAVMEDRRIKVLYRRWEAPREVERTLEPYGLVLKNGTWYVVAAAPDPGPPDHSPAGRSGLVERKRSKPAGPGGSEPVEGGRSDRVGHGRSGPVGLGRSEPDVHGGSEPLGHPGSEPVGHGGPDPVGHGRSEPLGHAGSEPLGHGGSESVEHGRSESVGLGRSEPVGRGRVEVREAGRKVGVRTYRVSNILQLAPTEEVFTRPPGFDLAKRWQEHLDRFEQERFTAKSLVRISPGLVGRLADLSATLLLKAIADTGAEPAEDGSITVAVPIESIGNAATQLIHYGTSLEVLEPSELRAEVKRLAEGVAALYQ